MFCRCEECSDEAMAQSFFSFSGCRDGVTARRAELRVMTPLKQKTPD